MLATDIARTTMAGVDARHPALAGGAAVLVVADLATGGARRPRDVRLATGLTAGGVSNLLGRLEAWASSPAAARLRPPGPVGRAHRADRRRARVARDVSAALVRGVGRSATAVDELILLEHLGAHGGPSGRERLLPARAAVPRALAALSTEPTDR